MPEASMDQFHMGINLGHDRSVAVVKDGEILIAIEQERLDGIKHSVGSMLQHPSRFVKFRCPVIAFAIALTP